MDEGEVMLNGLIGVHIATNIPVEIPLSSKEMSLACVNSNGDAMNKAWHLMDSLYHERTGDHIIGEIDIDYIVIRGQKHKFH